MKNPRKTRESEDSDNDGSLFRNMMNYMMFQNKAEAEQRERQARVDREDREREYQLRREEMVMHHEENRAQRQMMNLMMMAMLGGNQGGGQQQGAPQPNVSQHNAPAVNQDNDNNVAVADKAEINR